MIAVHFSKQFAQQVLDAIKSGKPIPLPEGRWTGNNMLTLAGILYAAVFSQDPHAYQIAGIDSATLKKMHTEKREAVEESFRRDIHNGIEFLSLLTFRVADGQYDQSFEAEVKAIIFEEDGKKQVRPGKGFKGHKDPI
jgi:hypothetical protein